jgi:hypothetical protein
MRRLFHATLRQDHAERHTVREGQARSANSKAWKDVRGKRPTTTQIDVSCVSLAQTHSCEGGGLTGDGTSRLRKRYEITSGTGRRR